MIPSTPPPVPTPSSRRQAARAALRYGSRSRWAKILFPIALLSALLLPTPASAEPALPENSLYQVASVWRDDGGDPTPLASLRGKPRILSMFFSRCDNICPMLMGQLKGLEREMPPALRRRVGFVLVSLDTESDDSQSLQAYRKSMNLDPDFWTILRGGKDDTQELAMLLGVQYASKQEDGQIPHTGVIALLDADGVLIHQSPSVTDPKDFYRRLEILLSQSSRPESP